MITRRRAVRAAIAGTIAAPVLGMGGASRARAQEGPETPVQLDQAPFDPASATLAVPPTGDDPPRYTGDLDALWDTPWDIGTKSIEIGCTIVQRFTGTADQGFYLGADGLVVQSVIYGKYGSQQYFFAGINSDLSELAGARTLLVTGTYGGVQHNTDSLWDDPIIIVSKLDVPQ